jgi:hypothetical protein
MMDDYKIFDNFQRTEGFIQKGLALKNRDKRVGKSWLVLIMV